VAKNPIPMLLIDQHFENFYGLLQAALPEFDIMAIREPTEDRLSRPESIFQVVAYGADEGEPEPHITEALDQIRAQRPNAKIVLFANEPLSGRMMASPNLVISVNPDTEGMAGAIRFAMGMANPEEDNPFC
jgi:hypothetical protein